MIPEENLDQYCHEENERLLALVDDMPIQYCKFLATYYPNAIVRKAYLKRLGVSMGEQTYANMGFTVTPNDGKRICVHIGNNVSIAPNVTCICSAYANNGDEINRYRYVKEHLSVEGEIYIEDEAWLGANSVVLPNVRIGRCAVVGAGCVMTKDADPYGIYAGVPGRKIGDIRQWEDRFEQ